VAVLLDRTFPSTLDALVASAPRDWPAGSRVEVWAFADPAARRRAAAALAAAGFVARVRSAFKPLVHAMLEEIDVSGARQVVVALPRHPAAPPDRFRLEAHPLAGMMPAGVLRLDAGVEGLDHAVAVRGADGTVRGHTVFAPNVVVADATGAPALRPCGWLRVTPPGAEAPLHDAPHPAALETAFDAILDIVRAHPWPARMPPFPTLEIRVDLPDAADLPLGVGHEAVRLAEVLHEDLYFGVREVLATRSGAQAADRTARLGQIVPDVCPTDGPLRVRITTARHRPGPFPPGPTGPLADADRPLDPDRIARAVDALGGARREGRSAQGRPIPWTVFPGEGPGIVISGGQHANETTGIVGALRAAALLRDRGVRNLAVIPLENPDGHALHGRLRAVHPDHMHHAARYTALGDDLEYRVRAPLHETATRRAAYAATGVRLHVNLHGYPAHEWTRPFTGYVPNGFGAWMLPKGAFLILRHHAGLEQEADRLVEAVARRVAAVPGIAALNAAQLDRHRIHAGEPDVPLRHGVPCDVRADARSPAAFTLITEMPDETVEGDLFRLLQTAQTEAVLAAVEALGLG
jgi:hypothetical protein